MVSDSDETIFSWLCSLTFLLFPAERLHLTNTTPPGFISMFLAFIIFSSHLREEEWLLVSMGRKVCVCVCVVFERERERVVITW